MISGPPSYNIRFNPINVTVIAVCVINLKNVMK